MPTPSNDVVEITLVGDMLEQEILTVHHYEKVSPSVTASEMAQSLATSYIANCLPLLSDTYAFREVRFKNLFDPSEQGTIDVIDQFGARIGDEAMPTHDTISFQVLHNEPQIRSGRKAVGGLVESANVGGVLTPTNLTAWQGIGQSWLVEALKDVATGITDIGRPVIVKRIAEVVSGVTRYRLPATAIEALVGYVYDTVLSAYIRTQNSRKVGYGD